MEHPPSQVLTIISRTPDLLLGESTPRIGSKPSTKDCHCGQSPRCRGLGILRLRTRACDKRMFRGAQMTYSSAASGNRFAIGLLLCGTIWMLLRVSGLFQVSPVRVPAWVGFFAAAGILAGPAILTLAQSVHWVLRIITAVVFLACAFIFPWFYDQFPICFWLIVSLGYVEVFWLIPLLLKRSRSSRVGQS
jgi:hypothetical protein